MKYRWLIVLGIIVIAIIFRFQHIQSIPPGLYPDEAMNGNNILAASKVFYPENNGREGLFMNIQGLSLNAFGNQPWALRVVAAAFGTLTVLGLYFLATQLFNWQIGALSSFLLAISFWHTLFSRIGFRAIMAPFFLVWGLNFFWRGLRSGRLFPFFCSGLFWGLGFYSYISFRAMPLVLILTLLAYWYALKRDFAHEKYLHTRNQTARGLALLMVTAIIVALPLGWYFLQHPQDFLGRTTQLSVFSADYPLSALLTNMLKTLGMFNFVGDWNWRHNFAGAPELFWPIGVFFAVGFLRSWYKLLRDRRRHGHLSTTQVLLLAWFVVGLLPVVFSNEGLPHALRAIIVAPVVMLFAAEGLWWIYDYTCDREGSVWALLAILVILTVSAYYEYDKYFNRWATRPEVADAYAQKYVALGRRLNALPVSQKKYVLVNAGGILVAAPDNPNQLIPMPAQTVMFITDTWSAAKQRAKNIYYLTEAQHQKGRYDHRGKIFPLEP